MAINILAVIAVGLMTVLAFLLVPHLRKRQ